MLNKPLIYDPISLNCLKSSLFLWIVKKGSMKHIHLLIRFWLTFPLLLLSGLLFSQEKSLYQPVDGQEGKDVRWFPTPQELVDKMLDMAKVNASDFLIDLGSGEGRTVISAAKRGARALGIEYDSDLVGLSKQNAIREGVNDKVEFLKGDLFGYDFSKATVLTLFLLPEINLRLRPKILEMKPGTRVVSTTFTMQTWSYDSIVKIDDRTNKWNTAYLWIVPAKVPGTWKFTGGELKLTQKFQMVSGTLAKGGKSFAISGGKLCGKDLTFVADGALYTCRVEKNTMKGTVTKDGKATGWQAEKK
jgi:hypothetical protein